MKFAKNMVRVGVLVGLLGVIYWQQPAMAEKTAAVSLTAEGGFEQTFRALEKSQKAVEVLLSNGQKYSGEVMGVSPHFVVLKLRNPSYFDAKIKIADVSAVEVQIRGQ